MENTSFLEIQCTECHIWFSSPAPLETVKGNRVRCPHCQEMVFVDENVKGA
ncbi:hypothetical protein [Peribacillus sp. SCS-155]|uniref:hypothetical protein n=1 Tax=Peribacillus sedimenti TaxID=3115297 RepID=UPI00390666AA